MAPGKMAAYATYWRGRHDQEEKRCQIAAEQATAEARNIAALLRDCYGATRVILFGSLARGGFSLESDIDLAVVGLAKSDFYTALADANDCTNRWVDLKPLEAVHAHFRSRIMETGIDLLGGSGENVSGGDECASYQPQH